MKVMRTIILVVLLSTAQSALAEDANNCPPCPECPSCTEEKDLSNWQLSTALGFNLTKGNSDTLLATNSTKADREINDHIYHVGLSASLGKDEDLDDEENGSTSQKQATFDATYKHLLSERAFVFGGVSAFFDKIADVDYRYIPGIGVGYFLIKNEAIKLSAEVGPSYVFEKQGGEKNDYLSPRFAERFDWRISDTSKFFQTLEVLLSVEDGDDTLVTAEAGLEAALNSSVALVLSVKDIYDNLPADDLERNDLSIVSSLKVSLL